MNIRDLRYFVAVATLGHFGKAADACHVSQPTLSGQLKKLEESLGLPLFERSSRSVTITADGEQILHHARALLDQVDQIEAIAQARRDPTAGAFRLGVIPTLSPYLMPQLLLPLKARCPRLHLGLIEETTDRLVPRLQQGEIDAALVATPVPGPALLEMPLFDERFWCACRPDHRLAGLATVRAEDLDTGELLLLADGHCLRDQALALCRRTRPSAGEPAGAGDGASGDLGDLSAASLDTLVQLVIAGYGVTLLPDLALASFARFGADLLVRPIADPEARRQVRLVVRRNSHRWAVVRALEAVIRAGGPG